MDWLDLVQGILAFVGFIYFYNNGFNRGYHAGVAFAWEAAAKAVEYDKAKGGSGS